METVTEALGAALLNSQLGEKLEKVIGLKKAGWIQKYNQWTHPKRVYQGLPYIFTFEQAVKAEGL